MTLAILVLSIFGTLAFVSDLFLKSLENIPHIYVFFNVGTDEANIQDFKENLESYDNIDYVEYTSEEEAKEEFAKQNEISNNPLIADEIRKDERSLPSSLAIRLKSISDADEVIRIVENAEASNPDVFAVQYSEIVINNLKSVVLFLRLVGGIIMALLITVVFFFTLLTVEFRTYSRGKEIEIMQLVGGSLWYIRLPFIMEGAFYGVVGATISNFIIGSFGAFLWYSQRAADTKGFILSMLSTLDWSIVTPPFLIGVFIFTLIIGALLGTLNSLIAIRRYIK
jgi:cell division transport system permease protein